MVRKSGEMCLSISMPSASPTRRPPAPHRTKIIRSRSFFHRAKPVITSDEKDGVFIRTNKKNVELTEVGRIFVEEARLALWHIDRAVHAARDGSDSILTIGHSPDADHAWISAILAIRLPHVP